MKAIIVYGSPVCGLGFVGPFDDMDAAIAHANNDANLDTEWWVVYLEAPEA